MEEELAEPRMEQIIEPTHRAVLHGDGPVNDGEALVARRREPRQVMPFRWRARGNRPHA